MAVDTLHNDYVRMLPEWQRNDDAVKGSRAIKAKNVVYLPVVDPDTENRESPRYLSYLQRAVYTNFTGRTVRALTGAVFRQAPEVELPDRLEYMRKDADSGGMTLETIAQRAVGEVLTNGRFIVLADFPEAPLNATAEQTRDLRPYLACYSATALTNWHVTGNDLDLAVLRECIEEPQDDGFTYDEVIYWRVLRLRDEGVTMQLYRENEPVSEEVVLQASGQPLRKIPIAIMGAEDNNADPDTPPISDIASLNIAHYCNSASYEEGVHYHGQPMLSIDVGDDNAAQWQEANPNFYVGSRMAVVTKGGGLTLTQAEANGAAMEAMKHKEDQMIRLGAQIISDASGQETAEGARIRSSAEMSVLNTVVRNVSDGFRQMLRVCAEYEGANPDQVEFSLNRKFFADDADATLLAQLWLGVDRGAWSLDVPRDYARRAGLIAAEVGNEELAEEAERVNPLGVTQVQ